MASSDNKKTSPQIITRFAPSPTGYLHKGHAYSVLMAYRLARQQGGRFILRIEDIDGGRCRPEFVTALYEDLTWLGLEWETPVRLQSEHMADYQTALEELKEMGVIYPCFCTRKEIADEIKRSPSAPHGPDGPLYPGTCKNIPSAEQHGRIEEGKSHAWRLDLDKGLNRIGHQAQLVWHDDAGPQRARPQEFGDIVLARKDTPTSYHLSVVVDDALQGVTDIVRGKDLFHATHMHVLLQQLLGLPTPRYHHHELLIGADGKRFAKRDRSETLRSIREQGVTPDELIASLDL